MDPDASARVPQHGGMSLHAAVAVPARDRRRLERLCRYVARPPIAQREVLVLMSRGLSNREIGETLGIAPGTVKTHLSALFEILDVSNRTEATLVMTELDLDS